MSSIFDRTEIKQTRKAKGGSQTAQYVVIVDGKEVGVLEKHNDTKTEQHPWKAFVGIGMACTFLGSYFGDSRTARIQARNAILSNLGLLG